MTELTKSWRHDYFPVGIVDIVDISDGVQWTIDLFVDGQRR